MRSRRSSGKKRALGWLLSALVLALNLTPEAALLRSLPERISLAAGQELALGGADALTLRLHRAASASGDETLGADTATLSLLGWFPLRDVQVEIADDRVVYPGGQAVGVAMHTRGVLVVGTSDLSGASGASPAREAGLKAGDVILTVDGDELSGASELTQRVAQAAGQPMALEVLRGETRLNLKLEGRLDAQSGSYRLGAWVRDSTAGVGTLSFYTLPEGGVARYGALGHAITDADTQQLLTVGRGELMQADVVDVRKGQRGIPGELKGSFLRENRVLGTIESNTPFGVYGALQAPPAHPLYPDGLPIGRKDAVHTGAASILSTVDAEGMKEYAVEIVEVARQSEAAPRSMIVRVTDERLLALTGGIVQGMSGSPILQDGRLIGAVTHVCVTR